MKKVLKKSEVLREGYIKGLKKAQRVINEMLESSTDPSVVYPRDIVEELWQEERDMYDYYHSGTYPSQAAESAADNFIQKLSKHCDAKAANDLKKVYRDSIIDFFEDDMNYYYDNRGGSLPLLGHSF